MPHLLFIVPGYVPPPADPYLERYVLLAEDHEVDVLWPVWGSKTDMTDLPDHARCRYHHIYSYRVPWRIRPIWDIFWYLMLGLWIHVRRGRIDYIQTYGTGKTGLAGVFLKWLTGAKLVAEINGVPSAAFLLESATPTERHRKKHCSNIRVQRFVLERADAARLLYPTQLDEGTPSHEIPIYVCHDFVPVSQFTPSDRYDTSILFLGADWYRKGVDVLIRAFQQIAVEFPEWRLDIIGHSREPDYFKSIAADCPRIEFGAPRPGDEAMRLMAKCGLFVLPSRSEAMGRVLLEAMAFRRSIVAAKVDGIPCYIEHEVNGLLCEPGNSDDLAIQLRRLLGDRVLAMQLAQKGYEIVHEKYSERQFVATLNAMVDDVLDAPEGAHCSISEQK